MVWESHYWKQKIKALIFEIEALTEEPEASTLDISHLEIAVFTGFFLVRKLIEAETKLSDAVSNMCCQVETGEKLKNAPPVDRINRFDIEELYNLNTLSRTQIGIRRMCNVFVHSVFMWMVWGEDGVLAVHITSSYDKERFLYKVSIAEIIRIFSAVAHDQLTLSKIYRCPDTGEWKIEKAS